MSTVKVTAYLGNDVVRALRDLAENRGESMTDALIRAISTEYFLQKEVDRGCAILLERPSSLPFSRFDRTCQIVFPSP